MTLDELRKYIEEEAPYIGIKPFSHNIIRMALSEIEEKFGKAEADKAIYDFNLEQHDG